MEKKFKAGDLVWAKVHRYPWWPAFIYHEDLSSVEIRQEKKEGFVLVSFYGDNTYKWLNPKELLPFESEFSSYSNRCRSQLFVKAVTEAVDEVNHRAAIGLTCPCKYFAHYRSTPVKGLLEVDTDGYKLGGVYAVNQIERFRQEFSPLETLSFVQKLAVGLTDVDQDLKHSQEAARALVYRKSRYAKIDEPYFEAFQVDPKSQQIVLSQDHPSDAEIQRQKNSTGKHQNRNQNKKSYASWKNKLHATNTNTAFIKEQPSSIDEGEKNLDFSSSKHDSPPAPQQLKRSAMPPAFAFQNRRNAGETVTYSPCAGTPVHPVVHCYQEIYAKFREEKAKRTCVKVGDGGIDISEKMLALLNECSRIVCESK